MPRQLFYLIPGTTLCLPINHIPQADMQHLKDHPEFSKIRAIPTCWSEGMGVWPSIEHKHGIIVQQIDESEI